MKIPEGNISEQRPLKDFFNQELLDLATNRMFYALRGYFTWKWLNQATSIRIHGKQLAERNVDVLNKHNFFFKQVIDSTFKSYIADLSIFFDAERNKESLSQGKLLGLLKGKLPLDEFNEIGKNIEKIRRTHGVKIRLIRQLRDEDVAHQTIYPQERLINYLEVEDLFKAVHEILNLISHHFNGSAIIWVNLEEEVVRHMEWIFENLERGETKRIAEIEKEYLTNSTS